MSDSSVWNSTCGDVFTTSQVQHHCLTQLANDNNSNDNVTTDSVMMTNSTADNVFLSTLKRTSSHESIFKQLVTSSATDSIPPPSVVGGQTMDEMCSYSSDTRMHHHSGCTPNSLFSSSGYQTSEEDSSTNIMGDLMMKMSLEEDYPVNNNSAASSHELRQNELRHMNSAPSPESNSNKQQQHYRFYRDPHHHHGGGAPASMMTSSLVMGGDDDMIGGVNSCFTSQFPVRPESATGVIVPQQLMNSGNNRLHFVTDHHVPYFQMATNSKQFGMGSTTSNCMSTSSGGGPWSSMTSISSTNNESVSSGLSRTSSTKYYCGSLMEND